jgi:hypothetical protein
MIRLFTTSKALTPTEGAVSRATPVAEAEAGFSLHTVHTLHGETHTSDSQVHQNSQATSIHGQQNAALLHDGTSTEGQPGGRAAVVELDTLCLQIQRLRITGRRQRRIEDQSQPGDFAWGDRLGPKQEKCFRIGLMNINGFPMSGRQVKADDIRGFLLAHQFDIMGFTEVNVHWNSLPSEQRLEVQTRGWFTSIKRTTAYYIDHPFPVPFIYGGISQWAMDDAVPRVSEAGVDPTGLGRWGWQRFVGRNGVALRVVTAYRPVEGRGPRSVWMQQKAFLVNQQEMGNPRQVFVTDLLKEVDEWLGCGDQIVLSMDANDDVVESDLARALRAKGLEEAVVKRHGKGPATYQRGVLPIDGMFVTPSLQGCFAGYVEGVSDHVAPWMDIPYAVAFGHDVDPTGRPKPRRLKCNDPRVVARYVQTLEAECSHHDLPARVARLFAAVTANPSGWNSEQAQEWETLDGIAIAAMNKAESGCRRLCMGTMSWTPYYSQLRACEKAWKLKLAGRTSAGRSGFFQRVCRKAGVVIPRIMTQAEAKAQLTLVRAALKEYREAHHERRQNWLEAMAEAHAEQEWARKGGSPQEQRNEDEELRVTESAAKWYTRLKRTEEQRRAAYVVRMATNRMPARQGVTVLIGPGPGGTRETLVQREDIERALLREAARRGNQAGSSPFLCTPLDQLVGKMGTSQGSRRILQGGRSQMDGVDPYAAAMLAYFRAAEVPPMPMEWNLERYTTAWRRAREQTASSPQSPHIGHYKAALASEELHLMQSQMAWMPYITGYSPLRWQHTVGVMIYKKPGNNNVELM